MPAESYAHLNVRFTGEQLPSQAELAALVKEHGFSPIRVSYWYREADGMEFRVVMHSRDDAAVARLSTALARHPQIQEFRLSPTGD